MAMRMSLLGAMVLVALVATRGLEAQGPPQREEVERSMGLRSEGEVVRGQLDTVGFAVTREQAEDVVARAIQAERQRLVAPPEALVAAVCPHDDHLYAAGVHAHATERIASPRLLLVGVFHRARLWESRDRVVFDRFQSWHGPWGPVPVDPLREELLADLPPEDVVVDNTMHCREHSLEGIIPFLQHRHRDLSIVPILVPYMGWERMEEIAGHLGAALAEAVRRNGWVLGKDLAVLISTDLVHYGGDFDHAPFGEDADGYREAVARDRGLIRAVAETNLLDPKPDFVVFGGDLAQLGTKPELDHGAEMLSKLNYKTHYVMGEHDYYLDLGAYWSKLFGDHYYSFDHKGVHFITLNSILTYDEWTHDRWPTGKQRMAEMAGLDNPNGSPFMVGEAQRAWLKKDLAKVDKKTPVVLFSHSPIQKLYKGWNFWTEDAEEVQACLLYTSPSPRDHG